MMMETDLTERPKKKNAGGFTVLAALCDSKVFTAGAALYGVSDLALLAADTHKVRRFDGARSDPSPD